MARRAETRERVRDLLGRGMTPREIALLLGISTQRVYVVIKRLRELDQIPSQDGRSS